MFNSFRYYMWNEFSNKGRVAAHKIDLQYPKMSHQHIPFNIWELVGEILFTSSVLFVLTLRPFHS